MIFFVYVLIMSAWSFIFNIVIIYFLLLSDHFSFNLALYLLEDFLFFTFIYFLADNSQLPADGSLPMLYVVYG